jgi:hypothetical protein
LLRSHFRAFNELYVYSLGFGFVLDAGGFEETVNLTPIVLQVEVQLNAVALCGVVVVIGFGATVVASHCCISKTNINSKMEYFISLAFLHYSLHLNLPSFCPTTSDPLVPLSSECFWSLFVLIVTIYDGIQTIVVASKKLAYFLSKMTTTETLINGLQFC